MIAVGSRGSLAWDEAGFDLSRSGLGGCRFGIPHGALYPGGGRGWWWMQGGVWWDCRSGAKGKSWLSQGGASGGRERCASRPLRVVQGGLQPRRLRMEIVSVGVVSGIVGGW